MSTNEMRHIARMVAQRYARQCWWADVNDMEQEAFVAIWQAQRTFRKDGAAQFATYADRAAVLAVRKWLWQHSSPVSTSTHRPEAVRGVVRVRLSGRFIDDGRVATDELLHQARRWRALRQRLAASMAALPLAAEVLLAGEKSRDVARRASAPVGEVYNQAFKARRVVRRDPVLEEIWEDR